MKKVLVDMTFVKPGSFAGVVIYAYRLIDGLRKIDHSGLEFFLLVNAQNKNVISEKCPNEKIIVLQQLRSKIPHLNGVLNHYRISSIIKKYEIDLFFSPFFSYESYIVCSVPHIAVLHDAQTFIIKKRQKVKGFVYRLMMKYLMSKVTQFVTISNYSKKNIAEITGIKKEIITVIYNSVEMAPSQVFYNDVFKKPYILNVNTIQPYKNLATLVRAFATIKDDIDYNLIIKGRKSPYWTSIILPIIKEQQLETRIFLLDENISSGQLTFLYEHAELFVSPSLMEGFGYTPIEAAICCVPVITTRETAIPETTMNLLNYYSPAKDYMELAKKMKSILVAGKNLSNLRNVSDVYKIKYSVESNAKSFCSFFCEVLNG